MTKYLVIKDAIHNININITLPGAAWNILPLTIFFLFYGNHFTIEGEF